MGVDAVVLITDQMLHRARTGGACKEAIRVLSMGMRIDEVKSEFLGWTVNVIPQAMIDRIATELSGVQIIGIDPYLLGHSGYGDGSGSGYGYGSGYGSGYGDGSGDDSGYGSGYGYGYGSGDGSGSGYGSGYGYGYGSGSGYGYGYGYG